MGPYHLHSVFINLVSGDARIRLEKVPRVRIHAREAFVIPADTLVSRADHRASATPMEPLILLERSR